jgi:selT/selW/selH-like putative selenoprotein
LAAEIRESFPGTDIAMIPSSGGRFEVLRDGVPVFEKSKTKRHAAPGEIVELLRKNQL